MVEKIYGVVTVGIGGWVVGITAAALLANLVTGTSAADAILRNIVPTVAACGFALLMLRKILS